MIDSVAIEDAFEGDGSADLVPTDGGRFDVCIKERTKSAVFWKEDAPCPIRRCSWFYQSNVDGRCVLTKKECSKIKPVTNTVLCFYR